MDANTQDTTGAPVEKNDDLDAIEREAQVLEGAAAQAQNPVLPASTTAADLLGALEMIRLMAAPLFADWADFGRAWSDQTLRGMADNGGAIMDRHGWTMGEVLAEWGPYIGLIAATAPAGLATYQHVQLRKAEAARQARERAARERTQQAPN